MTVFWHEQQAVGQMVKTWSFFGRKNNVKNKVFLTDQFILFKTAKLFFLKRKNNKFRTCKIFKKKERITSKIESKGLTVNVFLLPNFQASAKFNFLKQKQFKNIKNYFPTKYIFIMLVYVAKEFIFHLVSVNLPPSRHACTAKTSSSNE